MKTNTVCFLLIFGAIFMTSISYADIISWKCTYKAQTLSSNGLKCTQHVQNCSIPELTCAEKNQTLFQTNDFADYIAVSDNREYIAGLSNRGMVLPYWIRNRKGEMIWQYQDNDSIHYCRMTATNHREWFDLGSPAVQFEFEKKKLKQVSVRGCDGKRVIIFNESFTHPATSDPLLKP